MKRKAGKAQQSLLAAPTTGRLWPRLRRRKRWGLLIFTAGMGLTAAACFLSPRIYEARAIVQVFPASANAGAVAEMLRSPAWAGAAIEKLGLGADPELLPSLPAPQGGFKSLSLRFDSAGAQGPENAAARDFAQDLRAAFLRRLDVRAHKNGMIRVSYRSGEAEKAALVVNTVILMQQDGQRQAQSQAMAAQEAARQQELQNLQQKMRESLKTVHMLRARLSLPLEGRGSDAQEEQDLVRGIAQQRLALAALRTRLDFARGKKAEDLAALARGGALSSSALASPALAQALKREAGASARLAELGARYGEKHPRLRQAQREQAAAQEALAAQAAIAMQDLATAADLQEKQLQAMEERLAALRQQEDERMETSAALETEQSMLQGLRRAYADLAQQTQPAAANIKADSGADVTLKILSPAAIPARPVWPPMPGLALAGFVLSALAGLGAALLRPGAMDGLRTAGQAEALLRHPCYALIPASGSPQSGPKALADMVLQDPASALAEALRSLLVSLELRPAMKKPGVVAITSSFPDEGKTTLAVWLGRMAARTGKKVIVLDADLRRPSVHKALGKGNEASLAELLSGRSSLADVTQRDEATGMDFIAARPASGAAFELLASARLQSITAALRQNYDLVIVDLPACLAVADARLLAQAADVMLYAVSWNRTPLKFIRAGLKLLEDIHCKTIGLVLTNVDVKRHVRYGYGDSAHEAEI